MTPEGVHLESLLDTMREHNHHWVDLLEMDIEGKEWDVLGSLLQGTSPGIHATQLLIELHCILNCSDTSAIPRPCVQHFRHILTVSPWNVHHDAFAEAGEPFFVPARQTDQASPSLAVLQALQQQRSLCECTHNHGSSLAQ